MQHIVKEKKFNVCINRGPEFTCYLNCYHRGKIDRLPFSSNHFHMNVKTHEDHYEWKIKLDIKKYYLKQTDMHNLENSI